MKNLSILGITTLMACCMLFVVCKSESHLENPYKNKTEKELESLSNEKYSKIIAFASPKACSDATEWEMIEMQTVCGTNYLPYHKSVDKTTLQNMINDNNRLMEIYQPMMAPRINCIPYRKPLGVICKEGKADIKYE
ncbi:MAG: hypothetical protein LBV59_18330 [Sphingobacterium sp.]|jgi:hypothetical protein|uniref:hypothetical protein n=1 Tax=Sphingobacterium sp. TaxID=341027 RepID=UPI00284B1E03|nr:hypothetical protein [Sphingobacterium sp.]MDR3009899.1 hypothetical protein [Sphingobacterium sp.]